MTDSFGKVILRSVALGVVTAVVAVVYLFAIHEISHFLWGDRETVGWFSGGWRMIVIPLVGGLTVGLIYKLLKLPPRFKGFIDELDEGHVEPRNAPAAVLIALISLVSGPSLGPEAPLGTAGGAAGTWLARRNGGDDESVRRYTFIGMSGVFGGLLSTPLGGPLMAFELEHDQTHGYYFSNLIPGVISGGVAFAIVYPLIGAPFLGGVPVPRVEFESWMLAAAVGLGLLGAMGALVVGKVMVTVVGWMRRLDDTPVMRGLLGGAVVAAIGFALPLTMFSGQEGLETVVEEPASFSILLLVTLALLKTVALSASLGGGFYGGPIFPMFFIGGSLGVATHLALPDVPLGLALACLMAALGSAVAMLPLSMSVFAAVLVSADFLTFGAIAIAAATGYAVRHLVMSTQGSDLRTAAAENPD